MLGFLAAFSRMAARLAPAARAASGSRGGTFWQNVQKMAGQKKPRTYRTGQPPDAPERPQIDFGRLMGQAANPNAMADERARVQNETAQQVASQPQERNWGNVGEQIADAADEAHGFGKSLAELAKNATGLKDGMEGIEALSKGDLLTAFKSLALAGIKSATILFTLPFLLKKWTDSLVESRRGLETFNTSIGAAFSRLDMQKLLLNLRQANATAGSTTALLDQVARLRENTQAIRELSGNLINIAGTAAGKAAELLVRPIEVLAQILQSKIDEMINEGLKKEGPASRTFIDRLAGGDFLAPKDRLPPPPHLGPNWRP